MDLSGLDMKDQLFTDLRLLGFEVASMERKCRIPFKRNMFDLPNKEGFEVVIHFLFERLNPVKSREMFRDCWPVRDKKHEHQFRKICHTWLGEIAKEEASFQLPTIAPSLFLAPGGDRLYQLLLSFADLVLYKVMVAEHGVKPHMLLKSMPLTPDTQPFVDVLGRVIQASAARLRRSFLQSTHRSLLIQRRWKEAADRQVRRYRDLTKRIREREVQCVEARQAVTADTSSVQRGRLCSTSVDNDIDRVQRAQRLEKVRAMWQTVTDFDEGHSCDREILDSVLEGIADKYCIDARQMNVRVPELLLRECEDEIHRRGVQNIYEGGKLNLTSLLHLFNLSLHLYIEKVHMAGLPDVSDAAPLVTSQLQTHRAHLTNIANLKEKLETEIVSLKRSIKALRKKYRETHANCTPSSTKSPNCVPLSPLLNLIPPTPPVSFESAEADKLPYGIADIADIAPPAANVSTPVAAQRLMETIDRAIHTPAHPVTVPQGSPEYGHNLAFRDQQPTKPSQLPVPDDRSTKTKATKANGSRRGRPLPGHHIKARPEITPPKVTDSGTTLIETRQNSEAKKALASKQTSHYVTDAEPETAMQRFVIGACDESRQTSSPSDQVAFVSHDRLARTPVLTTGGYHSPETSPRTRSARVTYDDDDDLATRLFATGVSPSRQHTEIAEAAASFSSYKPLFTNMDVDAVVDSVTNPSNQSPSADVMHWSGAANVNTNSNVVCESNGIVDVGEAMLSDGHRHSDDSDSDVSERLIMVHEGSFSEVVVRTPSKNNTVASSTVSDTSDRDKSRGASAPPSSSKDSLLERYKKLRDQVMPARHGDTDDVNCRHDASSSEHFIHDDIPAVHQTAALNKSLSGNDASIPFVEQHLGPSLGSDLEDLLNSRLMSPSQDWKQKAKVGVSPIQLMPNLNSLPMSPMTSMLHNELPDCLQADDIFGENDSVLLPSSPLEGRLSLNRQSLGLGMSSFTRSSSSNGNGFQMSPPTGILLDL